MSQQGPRHARTRGLVAVAQGEQGSEAPLVPDLLDAVLDAVTVGVVVRRPDGRPIATNAASRDLLGPDPAGVAPAGDVPQRVTLPVTIFIDTAGREYVHTRPLAARELSELVRRHTGVTVTP